MTHHTQGNPPVDMGAVYDDFSKAFGEADKLPTWRFAGKPALERLLQGLLGPNTRVIEFGSASGRVPLGVLLPHGVLAENIAGVEISPEQVEMAKARIPGASFTVGDITDESLLSDTSGVFDIVFSHMVFEHLSDEGLAKACANANRLLKPGGIFAFVVTHPDKMTDLDGNLVTSYGAFVTSAPWGGELHNWRRSVEQTLQIVSGAGFAVEMTEEVQFPEVAPEGLDEKDLVAFQEASRKYRKYPAIRLAIRARKT